MKYLDLGCGPCDRIPSGYEIYGLDIDQRNIKECCHRFPDGHFKVWDIRNGLPFPDDYFDIVNSRAVLIYIRNIKFVIKEIKRVGKKVTLEELYSPNPIIRMLFPKYYLHNYPKILGGEIKRTPLRDNFLWDNFGYKIKNYENRKTNI